MRFALEQFGHVLAQRDGNGKPASLNIATLPAKLWQEGADGLLRTKQASIPIGAQIRRRIHIVLIDKLIRSASARLGVAVASRPQPWLV